MARLGEDSLIDHARRIAPDRDQKYVQGAHSGVVEPVETLRHGDLRRTAEEQRKGLTHHAREVLRRQGPHFRQRQRLGDFSQRQLECLVGARAEMFDLKKLHLAALCLFAANIPAPSP